MNSNKDLVIFHLFNEEQDYVRNFAYFLLFTYSSELDFVVVETGSNLIPKLDLPNVSFVQTENLNHDFGGYSALLKKRPECIDNYRNFYFVNSTCAGPFVKDLKEWRAPFEKELKSGAALVGATINYLWGSSAEGALYRWKRLRFRKHYPHVQSNIFVMPASTLRILKDHGTFTLGKKQSKFSLIVSREVEMSQYLIRQGKQISAVAQNYGVVSRHSPDIDPNPTSLNGDPLWPGCYFGGTVDPFDSIFIKTNRHLLSSQDLDVLRKELHKINSLSLNSVVYKWHLEVLDDYS